MSETISVPPATAPSSRSALITVFLVVVIDLLGFGIVLPLLPRLGDKYINDLFAGGTKGAAGGAMLGLLMAALTGLLVSPISWDHHWVWIAPIATVTAHYAVQAWRRDARRLVVALAAATLERFGHVDVICNNAGVSVIGPFAWETPLNDWEWVMRVNLGGVVNGIRAFVPHLVAQGSGHVVNTSSMAGITKTTLQSPYTASKFAVAGVSEGLRAELDQVAPDVGVTVVFPGILKTNILASESHRPAALAAPRPPQREELWEHVGVCANAISGDEEMGAPDAAAIVVRAIEANRLHVAPNGRSAAARSLCDSLLLDIEQR